MPFLPPIPFFPYHERWFYLVCDNYFCFILLLYLGLSSYVLYMYPQTVDIFTCLLMQVITDIKHLPPNDVLCICMWVCASKCIFLYIFSNTNAIYDRHIVQACWKHSRRPLRRGVSPSLLVSIFYSKSLINLKIK